MKTIYAIILASGAGERVGYPIPKQFIKIAGKSVLEHTIDIFERVQAIDYIIIVVHPMYRSLLDEIILRNEYKKIYRVVNGGGTRSESSGVGVRAIPENDAFVLVHDAVRPFLSKRVIEECITALQSHDAVDVAVPSTDTIIQVKDNGVIERIPARKKMYRGQTPQAFKVDLLRKAHALADGDPDLDVTDDCGLVIKYGLSDVYVVKGEESNMKITYPEDIFLADKLFQSKSQPVPQDIALRALEDKVVVVFGASRGIGFDIADISREFGAMTYGFSRQNGVDVSCYEQVSAALRSVFEEAGRIDFVVNTAGVLQMGQLDSRSIENIMSEINTNYVGAVNVVKASVEYLSRSKGGLLLFTSSSYTRGRALYSIYSSTKSAVVNMAQGLAEEFLVKGIRINVINPERTKTPMRLENFGREPEQTLLSSYEVAEASLRTLLSDITGQIVDVKKTPNEVYAY